MAKKLYDLPTNKFLTKIIKYYSPKKVILFGSRARGEEVSSSDLDIVVIAESNKNFIRRLKESIKVLPYKNLDILIYTPKEFELMLTVENQFISNVIREGKVIYEQKK